MADEKVDVESLCARIMALPLPDGEYAPGSIAGAVRSAVKTARAEALEEAAKMCEDPDHAHFDPKTGNECGLAEDLARRIRSLATDGGAGDGE